MITYHRIVSPLGRGMESGPDALILSLSEALGEEIRAFFRLALSEAEVLE